MGHRIYHLNSLADSAKKGRNGNCQDGRLFTILAISEIIESKELKNYPRPEPANNGVTNEKKKSWIVDKKSRISDKKNLTFIQTCKIIVPATSLIFMATFFGMGLSHQMENKD